MLFEFDINCLDLYYMAIKKINGEIYERKGKLSQYIS